MPTGSARVLQFGLLGAHLLASCTTPAADVGAPADVPAQRSAPAAAAAPAETLPIAQIRAKVDDEVEAMRRLLALGEVTGRALGEANNKLQGRSYFRRIPANPALDALRATLRQSAETSGLVVLDVRCELPADQAAPAQGEPPQPLKTTERWTVDEDQLLGTIDVAVDLEGSHDAIAAWIDRLPGSTERMFLIRQAKKLGDNKVRLAGQAFYERPQAQRRVEASWPSLDAWLRGAGHDPASAKVKGDPAYKQLVAAVQLGRELLPDVRSVLVSTNDLPRWAARAHVFDRCSRQIAVVDGQSLLSKLEP